MGLTARREAGIRAVAVVPHPPLLLPGAGGATDPLADLRERCLDLVRSLGDGPVVLLGDGAETRPHAQSGRRPTRQTAFSLHTVGVRAPLSLEVGGWLCAEAGVEVAAAWSVAPTPRDHEVPDVRAAAASTEACDHRGSGAVEVPDGAALLVVADGTAARGDKPPAGVHPEAQAWDDRLAAALRTADLEALQAFDPPGALQCQGVPAFRALARIAAGRVWLVGEVTHEAPFGVAYLTAGWSAKT